MAVSSDTPLVVATGGKENDLKLWDATSLTFQAKNVRVSIDLIFFFLSTYTVIG